MDTTRSRWGRGIISWFVAAAVLAPTTSVWADVILLYCSNFSYNSCGTQWVVQDNGTGALIAGTGFTPGGNEYIWDTLWGYWAPRGPYFVGESLYRALRPQELPAGDRRVFFTTESSGLAGIFDPTSASAQFFQMPYSGGLPPNNYNCGTSIGYLPSSGTLYVGYVTCDAASPFVSPTTALHEFALGGTYLGTDWLSGHWATGDWALIAGQLYNVATNKAMRRACILRQDGFTPACYEIPFNWETNWSTATFGNNGNLYLSLLARPQSDGNTAPAYRFDGALLYYLGATAMGHTFIEDKYRSRIFMLSSYRDPEAFQVWCSSNGSTFSVVIPYLAADNFYGPIGPTGTALSSGGIAWGHTPGPYADTDSYNLVQTTTVSCP